MVDWSKVMENFPKIPTDNQLQEVERAGPELDVEEPDKVLFEGAGPGPATVAARQAARPEAMPLLAESPVKRRRSSEAGPSDPRRLFDETKFVSGIDAKSIDDDAAALLWSIRDNAQTSCETENESLQSYFNSISGEPSGPENYDLDADLILAEQLIPDPLFAVAQLEVAQPVTAVEAAPVVAAEEAQPEGAQPAIPVEAAPVVPVDEAPVDEAQPGVAQPAIPVEAAPVVAGEEAAQPVIAVEAPPAVGLPNLDASLSNTDRVFQAIYYWHRSLGGDLETIFAMSAVLAVFPVAAANVMSGKGLIPGKLAKLGLTEHVNKGSGMYRMTADGLAFATGKGW